MPFFTPDVERGLVAGAFGLAGTLIPAALAWSRDRDVASSRMRKLDEATRRIAFWEQWLKVSTQIADPSDLTCVQRVRKELALLGDILESDSLTVHAQMSTQQGIASEYKKTVHSLSLWRRLLLLYPPERSLAWFPRLLFYIGLFSLIVFSVFQISDRSNVEGFVIVEFMTIVWIVVFRYLSVWLEQPHGSSLGLPVIAAPPPPPLPRS